MKYQVLLLYCLCVCLFSSFKVQAQNNNNARRMAKQLNKQLEVVIDKYVQVSDSLIMYRSVVDAIKLGQECDKYDAMPDITGQVKCQYRERNSLLLKAMRRLIIDAGLYFYKKNNKEEALNAFETYIYSADSPLFSLKHPEIDNFLNEAIFYSAVIAYKLGDYTKTRKFSEMLIDKDEYARDAVELQVLCLKQEMQTKEDSIRYCNIVKSMHENDYDNDLYYSMLLEYYSSLKNDIEYISFLQSEIGKSPKRIENYILLGDAYMKQNKWDEAISYYNEVLIRDTINIIPIYYNIGICYNSKAIAMKDSLTNEYGNIPKKYRHVIREYFVESVRFLTKVSCLDPERKKVDWAVPLYIAYYALSEKKKAADLKKLFHN